MSDAIHSCRQIDRRCPKCNSNLITNNHAVWCSFVRCDFGIKERVPLDPPAPESAPLGLLSSIPVDQTTTHPTQD